MKKNVLIINHSLQQGGIVRSLITALEAIDPDRYNITLYVHRDQQELVSFLPDHLKLVVNHDTNHYFRHPRAVLLQAAQRLFSLLRDTKRYQKATEALNRCIHDQKILHPVKDYFYNSSVDIVISYCIDICTEIALTIPAEKHYVFFHSSNPDFHRDMTERCFPQYDKIVAVSPGVEAVLREGFPSMQEKIICISNYVNKKTLSASAREKTVFAEADERIRICSCGRLDPEKGFDLAVEAARILQSKHLDFVWYFVGDGSNRKQLETRLKAYTLQDRIVITGFLLNPYPYLGGCDIYVQPSYEEAQPLAVMEAMILGKAIVSTETVGGKTILENGKKGVLTPITAEGLADGIETLIRSPERRRSFENLYSDEDDLKAKQEYETAWDRLLSE